MIPASAAPEADDHEAEHAHELDLDPAQPRRLLVAADRGHVAPDDRVLGHEPEDDVDAEGDPHRQRQVQERRRRDRCRSRPGCPRRCSGRHG